MWQNILHMWGRNLLSALVKTAAPPYPIGLLHQPLHLSVSFRNNLYRAHRLPLGRWKRENLKTMWQWRETCIPACSIVFEMTAWGVRGRWVWGYEKAPQKLTAVVIWDSCGLGSGTRIGSIGWRPWFQKVLEGDCLHKGTKLTSTCSAFTAQLHMLLPNFPLKFTF